MLFFFFKQKTAYEMRISDWSSDVCSSDLHGIALFEKAVALLLPDRPRPGVAAFCATQADQQWALVARVARVAGVKLDGNLAVVGRQRPGIETRHHPPHVGAQGQRQQQRGDRRPLQHFQQGHPGLLQWKTSSMRTDRKSTLLNSRH